MLHLLNVLIAAVPLFIVGGQSNTDGRLDNHAPDQLIPEFAKGENDQALVSWHSTFDDKWTCHFIKWNPCVGKKDREQARRWAYDTCLYKLLTEKYGPIYVAKTSFGGTSISPKQQASGTKEGLPQYAVGYHWSVDEEFLNATKRAGEPFEFNGTNVVGQSLTKVWIENIDATIDLLKSEGKEPEVKAIFWHQGESDRRNKNYANDFTALMTFVRKHLAEKLGDDKYLKTPVIFGTVPRASSLYSDSLDSAFRSLDGKDDFFMADIKDDGIMKKGDSKHFNAESAEKLARRMFEKVQILLDK